jgi:hypothetical protein
MIKKKSLTTCDFRFQSPCLLLHRLKQLLPILCLLFSAGFFSCKKDLINTSSEARLEIGTDSIQFDTVFVSAGSVTQYFLIKNNNKQSIRISNLELMGGIGSNFKINADGTPGTRFQDLEIEGNDSMYVFVSVTVDPNNDKLPFVLRDSIRIDCNGNTYFKQLEAWGQNAYYYRNQLLEGNITWSNDLPHVILGGCIIDTNAILTIEAGSRIYLNADAPFIVDGTVRVEGTKSDSVVFKGNRLDAPYKDYPGAWPGIYFRGSSINNQLTYAHILNAYQGIISEQPSSNSNPKVVLNNCILDNIYDIGLFGINSSIEASNCLISNCGNNVALIYGGVYRFTHCTFVSISNTFIQHKNPVMTLTNFVKANNQLFTSPLTATLTNCIIWGDFGFVDNELIVQKEGTDPANITLDHVLYRAKTDPGHTTFTNVIRNMDPVFDSIDVSKRYYNFRIKPNSPAINSGKTTSLLTDLDGNPRIGLPDLGCYEFP